MLRYSFPCRRSCLFKSLLVTSKHSSFFVSTQALFRQAFCCTYGTRRKYHPSPGLDTLLPLILALAWLASTSMNSSNPQACPGCARIHCLLQDQACAALFVETSRCQVKFSRFWAPCQPAICAQISGTIAQISAIARKYEKCAHACARFSLFRQKMSELPTKSSILSQVWSVEAAPI